jgi:hypothetical protein
LTTTPQQDLTKLIEARDRLRRMDRRVRRTQDGESGLLPVMEDFLCSVVGRGKRRPRKAGVGLRGGQQTHYLSSKTKATPETLVASIQEALK